VDRRQCYRVPCGPEEDLYATLELEAGEPVRAEIVTISGRGVGLRLRSQGPAEIVPDQRVRIRFLDQSDPAVALDLAATVRSVISTPGSCLFGLVFDPDENLADRLPARLLPRFNRRAARRVRPLEPVAVELAREDGKSVLGTVRDISWHGVGVIVPAHSHHSPLDRLAHVDVRFQLPGIERALCLNGRIQNERLVDSYICYGIQFEPEGTWDYGAQQTALKRYVARCFIARKGSPD